MRHNYKHITLNPFCSSNPSLNGIMKMSIAVLLPQIIMLFITKSYNSLVLLLCSIIAAQGAQVCYAVIKKSRAFLSWTIMFEGVIAGMLIPAGYPPHTLFIAVFTVLLLQNLIFGSYAQGWANAVVVILIVLYFINPAMFPPSLLPHDCFTQSNAGSRLFSEGIVQVADFDKRIGGFLNGGIFYSWGISVPEGYITLLWDSQSAIPAFRFNLLTLAASLILISYKAADSLVTYAFLIVYGIAVRMLSLYPYGSLIGGGDVLLAFCTGGTLFAAFFPLNRFGTLPMTAVGKCIYGAVGGLCMFGMCGAGTSSAAVFFCLLFLNILSPAVQYIEDRIYDFQLHGILVQAGIKGVKHE
ncbi:RnfABCDGE type electron transport complex subunit D [Treponema sp. HNW]|uniref:RnfABCDGE type electron transport complex subunit D n=1 Tax=Treponema sp. HNW TaxID=3116654 RepID=UPI003D0F0EA2